MYNVRMKRLLDIGLGLSALAATAPLSAGGALLILAFDGRPLRFRQLRLGRDRQPYVVWKFRTMREGETTTVGRLLRSTGIDELPQLFNVIRGEMSLVGPRPLTPADVTRLGWDDPRFDRRWSVPPGITGLAQIYPTRRCNARLTWVLDCAYIARQSTAGDLGLLSASMLCPFLGKKVTRQWVGIVKRKTR